MAYPGGGGRPASYKALANPYPYAYSSADITDPVENPERVPPAGPYYTLEDPTSVAGQPSPSHLPSDDSTTLENESTLSLFTGTATPNPYGNSSTTRLSSRNSYGIGIQRKVTRKVKVREGQALSIEHEVPSPVANAIQEKYRAGDLETGNNEFTHMRCMFREMWIPCLDSCN